MKEVGTAIYDAVALAKTLYARRKGNQSYKTWDERARENNERLESVRKKVRYSLYGVDEAFRIFIRLKEYVNQSFHDEQICDYFLTKADRLRIIMDDIVSYSFSEGCMPPEEKLIELRKCVSDIENKYSEFMENKNLSEK